MDLFSATYDLPELASAADVTQRTIRYYVQQGLLPAPDPRGPATRYDERHLERLRLIKLLQREHLPLAEIRRRLERMNDDEVRSALNAAAKAAPSRTSALDYVQKVLSAGAASFAAAPDATRTHFGKGAGQPIDRSQWERIALSPDVELHVRRPLAREQNKTVDRLLEHARRLFTENEP
jgi:DNA-binding transcriptional MerR regulator